MAPEAARLVFTIPGVIRGKQRAGRLRLPDGTVRSFNPTETAHQERMIRQFAMVQMRGRSPFTGPMRLTIRVYRLIPKSWSKKRRENAHWVTGKPDLDNIAKLVADSANRLVWVDDSQISQLIVERQFDSEERTHIEIVALEGT